MNTQKIIKLIKKKKKVYLDSFALEIGTPILETQRILNKLASEDGADIEADDNGELIYTFNNLSNEGELLKFISLLPKAFLKFFWELFVSTTKVVMLSVFISYSFLYFLIWLFGFTITSLVFMAISENQRNLSNKISFDEYFSDFSEMISYTFTLKSFHEGSYVKKSRRPFHEKIFSFIFGDSYTNRDYNHEENVLNFIRKNEKITLSDIINLTALTEKESQKLILSLLVKYEGEISVSDSSVIFYTFDEFDFRGVKNKNSSYIWERKLAENKLNENSDDDNAKIIIFGIVNLVLSSMVTYGVMDGSSIIPAEYMKYVTAWYGQISLAVSSLIFIVPVFRYPFVIKNRKISEKANYLYYLFNDFSFHIERDYVDMDETDDDAEEYLFKNFPNIFMHDFVDNKNVINLERYHEEIKFTSNNDPKSIKIFDPDDTDFLDSFDDF